MVFNNDVLSAAELVSNEFVALIGCLVAILVALGFAFWYDVLRKPKVKPRVATCVKCKYVFKTRWYHAQIKKVQCRTPDDPTSMSYITGKKAYPKFKCERHNSHGTCVYYTKVWWRR